VCYKLSTLLTVNAEKWGAKLEKWKGGANLLLLNSCQLLTLSSQLSVFLKLYVMNTLSHFLLCQTGRSIRNVSLGGPLILFLGLIQSRRHGGFGGLAPSNKASSPPKLKHETL